MGDRDFIYREIKKKLIKKDLTEKAILKKFNMFDQTDVKDMLKRLFDDGEIYRERPHKKIRSLG